MVSENNAINGDNKDTEIMSLDSMLFNSISFDAVFSNVISSQFAIPRIIKAKQVRLNMTTTSITINNLLKIVKSAFESRSHRNKGRNLDHRIIKLKD